MKVAVSGAMGRLGSVVATGVASADDMQLSGVYDPGHPGNVVAGMEIETSMENIDAEIVVECTHPDVVMENLKQWHTKGVSVVVGTSGFTEERFEEVKSFWTNADTSCLIVPNFQLALS